MTLPQAGEDNARLAKDSERIYRGIVNELLSAAKTAQARDAQSMEREGHMLEVSLSMAQAVATAEAAKREKTQTLWVHTAKKIVTVSMKAAARIL